ncbi:MAG: hypothetical protein Q9205_007528, partial [Flavoplaca limonia]
DDLVDSEGAKTMLRYTIINPLIRQNAYKKVQPNGILLYGPPGCATHHAIAVTAIFKKAKQLAPCIIFVDEIDAALRERTDMGTNSIAHTKSEFLKQWSSSKGTDVIVVGAISLPQTIDVAFLARMNHLIHIKPPRDYARLDLKMIECKAHPPCELTTKQFNNLATGCTKDLTRDQIIKTVQDVVIMLENEVTESGHFIKLLTQESITADLDDLNVSTATRNWDPRATRKASMKVDISDKMPVPNARYNDGMSKPNGQSLKDPLRASREAASELILLAEVQFDMAKKSQGCHCPMRALLSPTITRPQDLNEA